MTIPESLSVLDRLVLLSVLPAEGSFVTLTIVQQLRLALSFSEEEHEALQMTTSGHEVRWNMTVPHVKSVDLGKQARAIIHDALKRLSDTGKLTAQHLALYERFVSD